MRKRATVIAAGLALLAPATVLACGHCLEDRVAMVYDHGVVTSARNNNRQMAIYGIEVSNARLLDVPGMVTRALASVRGVNPRSMRISMDAAAFSFSFDRRTTAPRVQAALEAALGPLGLRVRPLEGLNPEPSPRPARS